MRSSLLGHGFHFRPVCMAASLMHSPPPLVWLFRVSAGVVLHLSPMWASQSSKIRDSYFPPFWWKDLPFFLCFVFFVFVVISCLNFHRAQAPLKIFPITHPDLPFGLQQSRWEVFEEGFLVWVLHLWVDSPFYLCNLTTYNYTIFLLVSQGSLSINGPAVSNQWAAFLGR